MRNNKWRDVLTHARVKFSQSETSSLPRGGGGRVEILVTADGEEGVNRKDPRYV